MNLKAFVDIAMRLPDDRRRVALCGLLRGFELARRQQGVCMPQLAVVEKDVFWVEESKWPEPKRGFNSSKKPETDFERALAATAVSGKPLRVTEQALLDYTGAETVTRAKGRLRARVQLLYPGLRLQAYVGECGAMFVGCVTATPKKS